jgi:protein ImuB
MAEAFSPRYERHGDDLVSIDVSGLDRLLGPPRIIGEELRREAAERGICVHAGVATTRTAALVLALARPGVTVVTPGEEAAALAPLPIRVLEHLGDHGDRTPRPQSTQSASHQNNSAVSAVSAFQRWGIKTLGEVAALPPVDLRARLGTDGLVWQAIARGEDVRPLVPSRPEERFDSSIELEWPIEGLEPLSFVLTRLLEPLSTRLERRDRGAAAIHVHLRLVTKEVHARRLQLPSPMRDVRALRTLALLDLESHPPAAAIDRVTVTIDPTPARVLQHTLFTRPVPTPEQIATLLARLGALMGQDRIGAPATVDSYRPGAFEMKPFATDHKTNERSRLRPGGGGEPSTKHPLRDVQGNPSSSTDASNVVSALRRCRQPVPARVAVGADQRPARVATDRRGFAGGAVLSCAGPWRTSGEWWTDAAAGIARAGRAGRTDGAGGAGGAGRARGESEVGGWNRDEWDVALSDGAVYRIFRDRVTDGWFIDAIVD